MHQPRHREVAGASQIHTTSCAEPILCEWAARWLGS